VVGALAKAERYRLLAQPWEAECIYRDVLQTDAGNEAALAGLILALTDQMPRQMAASARAARDLLPRLGSDYDRAYYAGIICERQAKALLDGQQPGVGPAVHALLADARSWFERAEAIRPPGNDDALLRWNACVRLAERHPEVAPAPDERPLPYADA
jgi:hypothetical protein